MISAEGKAEASPRARSIAASLVSGLAAHRRDRDREFGGFALDRVAPVVVVIAHLQQAVARAQRAVQRRDPAGMLAVDRQHQPIEEPPPLRCRAHEQPVHRRRQPHHAQVIAERRRRSHRLAVDPAAPAGGGRLSARRIDAGAERRKPQRALDLGGYRPGAVALIVGDIVERGAAQAASRRQKRDRLDAIGLAGAVRARPAPPRRRASQGSPRDNCGNASASGGGCGRGS